MNEEKYIPSPEEIEKAEEMMTLKEKKMGEKGKATFDAGGEEVSNKIKKFEFLSKELKDKGIGKNDLVRVWLSAKYWKGGPEGAYSTFTKGYFDHLTEEYLEIHGYTFRDKKVEEKINIEDIEKIDKEQK